MSIGVNGPKVGIVIINWKSYDDIVECVDSIKASDYINYEIIVVDNASPDGSGEQIEKTVPGIVFIKSKENLGWGGGNNLGIKAALARGADYAWLLNADTKITPDCLSEMVRAAQMDPAAGLLTPLIYYYLDPQKLQHAGSVFNWPEFSVRSICDVRELDAIDENNLWLWGTALLIKKELLEAAGYYNEEYFVYCEDMEYAMRARQNGYTPKVVLSAKIYHKCHEINKGVRKNMPLHYYFYQTRNVFWFWASYVKGFRKLRFLRFYLIQILEEIGHSKELGRRDIIDACLDGFYCALRNKGGVWDSTFHMPKILKGLATSHPFFFMRMLKGEILCSVHDKLRRA